MTKIVKWSKLLQYCFMSLVPKVKLIIPWQIKLVFFTLENVGTTAYYHAIFITLAPGANVIKQFCSKKPL